MKSDIDEGNFCDVLLKRIGNSDNGNGNRKNNNNTKRATVPSELINGI
jgi:hypothetical protein